MKKNRLLLLFIFSFLMSHKLLAQEEIYDQPVRIIDTLNNSTSVKKEKEKIDVKQNKDDAKTEEEKRKDRLNRIRIGLGNFGLQFGTYTYIQATPTVGYVAIKDRLEVGAGPILIYQRIKYSSTYSESFFVYGADIYARGYVYKGAYLESRYDLVNKPSYYDANKRLNVSHLLLGAGYAQRMGKIGSFNATILFNVLNNKESIYRGTFGNFPMILNFGFNFGIGGK